MYLNKLYFLEDCQNVCEQFLQHHKCIMPSGQLRLHVCRLERLELTFCGRGLTEAAANSLTAAGPLDRLQAVTFRGAYRLTDAALCSMLRNMPNLQVRLFCHMFVFFIIRLLVRLHAC